MRKIQYRYTHLTKQLFIFMLLVYTLLRFIIMMQIIVYKIPEYYENTNIPLTLLLYAVLFTVIIAFFCSHKFCYSTYDDHTLTYHNRLLRKSKAVELSQVRKAVFSTMGVKFYDSATANSEIDKPIFFLPFFRGGIIQVLQIDQFYKILKAREDIAVKKTFRILPGYSNRWKAAYILYGFLSVIVFMNCSTPLTLIIVLFQNHSLI